MAEDVIEGVSPTRMELFKIKNKLKLAEKGHRLLKERRDALVMEFMNAGRAASEAVDAAVKQLSESAKYLKYADSVAGSVAVDSAALAASGEEILVEVKQKSVVGVKVPALTAPKLARTPKERNAGIVSTHPMIEKTAEEHEKSLEKLLKLMEVESTLVALALETKRTKRRVNALEYSVIPKLKNTQKYIRIKLDEIAMEDFYRLKMFKARSGG